MNIFQWLQDVLENIFRAFLYVMGAQKTSYRRSVFTEVRVE